MKKVNDFKVGDMVNTDGYGVGDLRVVGVYNDILWIVSPGSARPWDEHFTNVYHNEMAQEAVR